MTPTESRLLSSKKQIAVYNKDYKLIKKLNNIKIDKNTIKEIKKYSIKR